MVGLEQLLQLGMAKKAHAGPLDSAFTPPSDLSAGERHTTLRGPNAQNRLHTAANSAEQADKRNAWHEESHG